MWNVKSYQWIFCILKTYLAFWNPSVIFITMQRAIGKYWFTELISSYKYWPISLYNMKKTPTFVSILPISSEKPLNIEKLSCLQWWVQVVLNSNACLKVQILSLAINIVIVFLEMTVPLSILGKMCQIPNCV